MSSFQYDPVRSTQPHLTADQAREKVWVRSAFLDGVGAGLTSYIDQSDMLESAAMLCAIQMACVPGGGLNDDTWMTLMFDANVIARAQKIQAENGRIHRLINFVIQLDRESMGGVMLGVVGADVSDRVAAVLGVNEAQDIVTFMGALAQKTEPYRATMRDKMRGMVISQPVGSRG